MNNHPTIEETIRAIAARFEAAGLVYGHGTDNALDEAAWLVSHSLDLDFEGLEARLEDSPTPAETSAIETLVHARIDSRKPLAYLIHEAWFVGLPFYVDERVIIPRSHIGGLIMDGFAPWLDGDQIREVLDLCTGSGCIAIAAALALPHASVVAADLSSDALAVTRINCDKHGVTHRVEAVQSDLFENLAGRVFDLILSNPPYVGETEMAGLPPEYLAEPDMALRTGLEGLEIPLKILLQAPAHLRPEGLLVMEVGATAALLEQVLPQVPFTWISTDTGEQSMFLLNRSHLVEFQQDFSRLLD